MHPIPKVRFEQFSDGVFAIAITLLALELPTPAIPTNDVTETLHALAPLVPGIITFLISFVTIAIFWVNHHQLTQLLDMIRRRRILWINMLFLFFLTLIPFITKEASASPFNPITVLSFSLFLFGASVSFSLLRYFIHKNAGEMHIPMGRSVVGPSIYLLAAAMTFLSVPASYLLLAIPALYYFLPKPTPEPR
ncbi:MAG TPA: TMEM175 family protein [Candidatus Paceibacterota bacterium]|nr:TMEM175 family protein [Candidatus Paceibacterota bacterium]